MFAPRYQVILAAGLYPVPGVKEKAIGVFCNRKPVFQAHNGVFNLVKVSVQYLFHGKAKALQGGGHVVGIVHRISEFA